MQMPLRDGSYEECMSAVENTVRVFASFRVRWVSVLTYKATEQQAN